MDNNEFMKIANMAMNKAKKMGVQAAEIYLSTNQQFSLKVSRGSLQDIKSSDNQGIGIRIINDQKIGFAFTSDISENAFDRMLSQAVQTAKYNGRDEFNRLAEPCRRYPEVDIFDQEIFDRSIDEKLALALEAEKAAAQYDKRVKFVERSGYQDGQYEVWIANSTGLVAHQKGSYCSVYSLAVGEENGERQNGSKSSVALKYRHLDPKGCGRQAGERAVRLLGAKSVPSQVADVVFDPDIAAELLDIISYGFSSDAVIKDKSLFKGKEGQMIASPLVTIIDDGTLPGQIGTTPFDGEGVPSSKTVVVENGNLVSYLYDTYTANRLGVQSTGNGGRGSFKGVPSVGTTNFYLAPGKYSREKLVGEVDKGLYVTDILGAHTANPVSGDFSFGASGLWIENGKFVRPVRGITIAGNMKDLLMNINGISNDLEFNYGMGSPTIRVGNISISGS